jgi:CubicO group peptidase (beta-lactamase class C family)
VLVVRNGYIVFERYYQGGKDDPRTQDSITKTFMSALSGIAIGMGLVESPKNEIYQYLPDSIRSGMNTEARKITVHYLLTMTSGFGDNGGYGNSDPGYLKNCLSSVTTVPGKVFGLNGDNVNLLSAIITQTSGMRASEFAKRYLFDPIGIKHVTWREGSEYTAGHDGLYLSTRNMAKFGYLFIRKGKWEDKQIIPEEWISVSTKEQVPIPKMYQTPGINDAYGYLWWTMWYSSHSAYSAIGYNGQRICVIPDFDLEIVFTGMGGGMDVEHLPIINDCIFGSITPQ